MNRNLDNLKSRVRWLNTLLGRPDELYDYDLPVDQRVPNEGVLIVETIKVPVYDKNDAKTGTKDRYLLVETTGQLKDPRSTSDDLPIYRESSHETRESRILGKYEQNKGDGLSVTELLRVVNVIVDLVKLTKNGGLMGVKDMSPKVVCNCCGHAEESSLHESPALSAEVGRSTYLCNSQVECARRMMASRNATTVNS